MRSSARDAQLRRQKEYLRVAKSLAQPGREGRACAAARARVDEDDGRDFRQVGRLLHNPNRVRRASLRRLKPFDTVWMQAIATDISRYQISLGSSSYRSLDGPELAALVGSNTRSYIVRFRELTVDRGWQGLRPHGHTAWTNLHLSRRSARDKNHKPGRGRPGELTGERHSSCRWTMVHANLPRHWYPSGTLWECGRARAGLSPGGICRRIRDPSSQGVPAWLGLSVLGTGCCECCQYESFMPA